MAAATIERALTVAREHGSRARSVRGAIRYLHTHPDARSALAAPPAVPVRQRTPERRAIDAALGRACAYVRAAGCPRHLDPEDPLQVIAHAARTYLPGQRATQALARLAREAAGCERHDSVPVVVLAGRLAWQHPREVGHRYYHRWRGAWKSWTGSYQHSTRAVTVGWEWLAARATSLAYDRAAGAYYHAVGTRDIHGIRVGYAYDGRPAWRVVMPGGQALTYPRRRGDTRRAIARRAIADTREARRELDRLSGTWVSREDSIGSGNCEDETERVARQLGRLLGAPAETLGAVRADVLLRYRDDLWTRRAVRYAQTREVS